MAVVTANKAVTSSDWTVLFTGASGRTSCIIQIRDTPPLLIAIGTAAPSAGDADQVGRLGFDGRKEFGLSVDVGDVIYGRFQFGTGNVTVAG